MEKISAQLHYGATAEELLKASTEMVLKIYTKLLGREPELSDQPRLRNSLNPNNNSINDIYFDGNKVGELATTFIVDSPGGINLDFTPIK